ncbi:MAG TPA: FAD-binding oxidoreductase [Gemmatimonadaceae bacterium]|nr:FAD-binding oxidoreductase [Gemmatimonadaceae bacterium]
MSADVSSDRAIRQAYEADSSGLQMIPDLVARPETIGDVVELVKKAASERIAVTSAGAQTSTTGASITDSGILLSLRSLNQIGDLDDKARTVRVGPGAIVAEIKKTAAAAGLLFAPDPTSEEESTIGGAIACNASGARTFKYGATRRHVRALKVVMASGELVEFRRSDLEKNTVGYAFAHDPIDWFIGSEGTLGVIVEAELGLLPLPQRVVGLAALFKGESDALKFVIAAREAASVSPRCIEYFDARALEIARLSVPGAAIAKNAGAMVYVEEEITEDLDASLVRWLELIESIAPDFEPLVFDGEARLREARRIRHSIPATMNERGGKHRAAGGRKVGTDWAVPYRKLEQAIQTARTLAAERQLEAPVIYGHAGNGHPHQNFIARDANELTTIEGVVERTLKHVLSLGGTVAAEHGIGKIKRRWLPLQMNPIQISMMTAVKRELDPLGILAPGNIL